MKTTFSCTVKYADVDSSMQIRLANLLNYLLEASDDSVSKTGISTAFLRDNYNAAWVLARMNMMMYDLPKYNSTFTVETWVEQQAHQMVHRNYVIRADKDDENTIIGRASSVWTIIDLQTRKIVESVFEKKELWQASYDAGQLHLPAMMHSRITTPDHISTRNVRYSDTDFNGHLNSCKYISYLMDACSFMAAKTPVWMDIKYSRELQRNEEVSIRLHAKENEVEYEMLNPNGEVACTAVITSF